MPQPDSSHWSVSIAAYNFSGHTSLVMVKEHCYWIISVFN